MLIFVSIIRNHEIPGSNPGQDCKSCWPNGKARDYGCCPFSTDTCAWIAGVGFRFWPLRAGRADQLRDAAINTKLIAMAGPLVRPALHPIP